VWQRLLSPLRLAPAICFELRIDLFQAAVLIHGGDASLHFGDLDLGGPAQPFQRLPRRP
jgi:hypothetical protein